MNRELIYQRVFAFFSALTLGGSPAFKYATRNIKTWNDVPPESCPALLLSQHTETAVSKRGIPTKWDLSCMLYLYVNTGQTGDDTAIPSAILNPLIDLIEAALAIDDFSNNVCTLGGLVSHAYFSGSIVISEGNLGNEAAAAIPINILVPA